MNKFVKAAIFVLAVVAGSIWFSNAIVWVGNKAKLSLAAPNPTIEQTTPQSGN